MAVDKNKVIADATKLVQKGQYDKAIKAYQKILVEDPKDVRVLLKVGELQQKKGDSPAAAETFGRVADAYGEQGFFLKAVAVYKQMLKLSPDDVRVNERLAGLYQQLGILSDAMAQLQAVAAAAEKAGDQGKLHDVLRRMAELEPDNVASAVKLGELFAKRGQTKPALEQLRRAADTLKRNNRGDEYVKVAERIAYLAPDDLALTRELANVYLARGDTKRALAKLQLCFKAEPRTLDTLTLLAQAFKDLGQISKTVSVYKEMAHIYAERGQGEDARTTWRRVLELAPDDAEAVRALPSVPPPRAAQSGLAQAAVPPPFPPRTGAAAPAGAPAPPAQGKSQGPEAIPKLLTETDVYVKYGLHEKALEHLKKVFAIDPDHLEAHEKALQLRATRNDVAGAADEAVRVAYIALARGLGDRVEAAVARLRELDPAHPELANLEADAYVSEDEIIPEEELVLEVEGPATEADELALAAVGVPADETTEEELVPAPAPEQGEQRATPRPAPAAPPMPLAAPPPPGERAAPAVAAKAPAPSAPAPARPPPASAPSAAARPATPVAGRPQPAEEEEDLDEELGEASHLIQAGKLDAARDVLDNLRAFYPRHSKLVARLAQLEELAARQAAAPAAPAVSAPPPAAPVPPLAAQAPAAPPPTSDDGSFDLARELAEELGSTVTEPADEQEFQYSVADVFDQFKRGVAETVKAEDSETHYDLGIAYREMGLLDDALNEFEVALNARGRKKDIECLTSIALCKMEKGDPAGAAESYRRALRSDHLTPDAARAVHYELALALEAAGDPQAALHYLHKVLKADPGYRDARAVVARLGGGPGRPPADEGGPPAGTSGAAPDGAKKNIGFV